MESKPVAEEITETKPVAVEEVQRETTETKLVAVEAQGETIETKPVAEKVQGEEQNGLPPPSLISTYAISTPDTQKQKSTGKAVTFDVDHVVTVDVHQAKDLVTSGHRYIDVRTEEEYNKGHVDVENALNIPYMFNTPQGRVKNPEFLDKVSSACSKDDYIVVGCQSGVRSLHASVELLNSDFKHVNNMRGGYAAWVDKGLAVRKAKTEL